MISIGTRQAEVARGAPSEPLQTAVADVLGIPVAFEFRHQWAANRAKVWRVTGAGVQCALKVHLYQDLFRQESEAYRLWISRARIRSVPMLVAALPGAEPALLLSWIDGTMFDDAELSLAADLSVFEQAGSFLRAFHSTANIQTDCHDRLTGLVRSKIINRCDRFRRHLPDEIILWAQRAAESEDWPAVPVGMCHRDFSPRNWMVNPHPHRPHLTVFDFENVEAYFLADDFLKLWDRHFIGRPDRRQAFYSGYGARLEYVLWHLRLMAPVHGLALMAWGADCESRAYFDMGRAFLDRAARNRDWMFD
jgi:Ser/Thr protein kinase RdoA (MazF antagonist)